MAPEVDEPAPDPALLGRVRPLEMEPLLLPAEDEPAPEPELLGNIRPPELELPLLPAEGEPCPEPELLGSIRPPELELPLLPVEDEPAPEPELLGSVRPVDCEPPVPDPDPGVGLPPLKTIPAEEETPGSNTAVVDPNPLKESGPNPASIARGSSDSKAVRVDGCVFLRRADRMAASCVDLSDKETNPLKGGEAKLSFRFRQVVSRFVVAALGSCSG